MKRELQVLDHVPQRSYEIARVWRMSNGKTRLFLNGNVDKETIRIEIENALDRLGL
jgi:hypothetical protein